MLEISILVLLCKYVYKTADSKGYPGILFAVLMVISWFAGGIIGGVVGMLEQGDGEDYLPFGFLIGYLVGVMLAAGINYAIVSALPESTAARPNPTYEQLLREEREEMEYVQRRRRGEPERRDEVVVLTPAEPSGKRPVGSPRVPVAQRAETGWKPKWNK